MPYSRLLGVLLADVRCTSAICQHACTRKEKSITASVLILRFFHGYVPREVAKLTQSSRNIVDVHLNSARAEALACVGSSKLVRTRKRSTTQRKRKTRTPMGNDLLSELREEIFATRRGECFDTIALRNIYHSKKAVSRTTLSHLVSCPHCLDNANALLGLRPLRERNAIDFLGRSSEERPAHSLPSLLAKSLGLICSWPIWFYLSSTVNDFLC